MLIASRSFTAATTRRDGVRRRAVPPADRGRCCSSSRPTRIGRRRGFRRGYGLLLLPVAIWFTLAPAALGTIAVFAPGYVLVAGSDGDGRRSPTCCWLRQRRLLGASIVGAMLLVHRGAERLDRDARPRHADAATPALLGMIRRHLPAGGARACS